MKRGLKHLFVLWCYMQYRRDRELTRLEQKHGCLVCGKPGCSRRLHCDFGDLAL